VDERWIELDYGELDLRPAGEVAPATWAAWRADPSFTPPGGESLAALGERVRAACSDLAAAGLGAGPGGQVDHVVVVSHVSPIKAAVAWVIGAGDEAAWRLYVAPASVTRIGFVADGHPVLRSFNETLNSL
jgi:broad specificity phosphatase PhoE